MKVLVTGAGSLCGQGIIRCLMKHASRPHIVAVDPGIYSAGFEWADRSYIVPQAVAPHYIARIRQILDLERPDVLMIGTDVELRVLSGCKEILEKEHGCRVLVSSPEVVRIADDKLETYEFMQKHGLNPPMTVLPRDLEKLVNEVGFPVILKPRIGGRSLGVRLIECWPDVDVMVRTVCDPMTEQWVMQERIGTVSEEYTAGVLWFPPNQLFIGIVMRRELRDGNTYRAFVEPFPELCGEVLTWARKLKPFGPCNFQFRIDGKGRPRCFEINARFSGTTPFRRMAGFDEVGMSLDYLVHGKPLWQPEIKPMVIQRYWNEVVITESYSGASSNIPTDTAAA